MTKGAKKRIPMKAAGGQGLGNVPHNITRKKRVLTNRSEARGRR